MYIKMTIYPRLIVKAIRASETLREMSKWVGFCSIPIR